MDSQHRVSDNRSRRSGGNRNQSASSRAAQTRNVNTESQPEGGLVPPEQGDQQPDTTYTDATGPLISPVAQAMAPELAWRGYAARPQLHGSFSPYIYGTAPAFYEPRLPVSLGASAGFPLFASGRQLSQQSNFSIDSSFSDASSSGMGTGTGTGTGMSVICNMVLTPSSIADGYTTASTTPISGPVSSPSFQDQQQLNAYSPLYSTPLVVAPAPISQSQSSSLFETTAPAAPSVSVLISLHNVQPTHWPSVPIATAPAMENLLAEYTPDLFLPHTANDLGNFPGVDMSPTPYETF
ncbi:hypothetical protein SEPCBS57363_000099 [Sporothrix epigloea]|uniref:Uncharacterized protein n=1 Tax=Sporothrix epigloea TaxID=1892477 RepID=A0ABP0D5J2_9PEZI